MVVVFLDLCLVYHVPLRMDKDQPMKSGTNEYDLIEEFVTAMSHADFDQKLKEKSQHVGYPTRRGWRRTKERHRLATSQRREWIMRGNQILIKNLCGTLPWA